MNKPDLCPNGLHKNSLAALLLDFMARERLGLLGFAAAADVLAADCRFNFWVASTVKGSNAGDDVYFRLADLAEECVDVCKAAMNAFRPGGAEKELISTLSTVAERLNDRTI